MRLERFRDRAACDGLHHGRFHFNKSMRVHKTAERLHQLASLQKDFAHFRVHDQIDVTLPVAQLHIRKPVPFFRKRQQVLGKECDLLHMNGEFAGPGTEQISAYANVITEVEQAIQLKSLLPDGILLHIDLQSLPILLQMSKTCLAHEPVRHNAAGDADLYAACVQLFRRLLRKSGKDLPNVIGVVVAVGIRPLTEGFNLLQLFAAQFVNVLVECQWVLYRFSCREDPGGFEGGVGNNDYKQACRESGSRARRTSLCDASLLLLKPISANIPLPVFPRGKESLREEDIASKLRPSLHLYRSCGSSHSNHPAVDPAGSAE